MHTHTPTNANPGGVSQRPIPDSHRHTQPSQKRPCPNPRLCRQQSAGTENAVRQNPPMRRCQHGGTQGKKETQRANAHKTMQDGEQVDMGPDCSPEVELSKLAVDPARGHLVHLDVCGSGSLCDEAWEASNVAARGSVGAEACATTEYRG